MYLTNGKGYLFEAEIVHANPKHCAVQILEVAQTLSRPYRLHMAVAPTKMNDRYAWFLEKATEIGVDEITPLICEHSERRKVKPERMERVLQAAIKQSCQTYLPQLNPATTFQEFITKDPQGIKCIAHCATGEKAVLKTQVPAGQNITILIGPEGDFSEVEIALAHRHHYIPVTLGKNRLRTETAAILACATVALANS